MMPGHLIEEHYLWVASEKMQIYNDKKYTIHVFMQIKEQPQQV